VIVIYGLSLVCAAVIATGVFWALWQDRDPPSGE
jgi:hypothetical protein